MEKRIAKKKRKVDEDEQLYEDESEAEDIFGNVFTEIPEVSVKKKFKRQGPTTNCHSHVALPAKDDWVPSCDEEEPFLIREEEDDGCESLPFVLPNGRKSRAKKREPRVWYDGRREQSEQ